MIGKVVVLVKEGIMFYFTFIIVSTFASEMTINQTESQTNIDHYCQAPGPGPGPGPGHVLVKVQVKVQVSNKLKIEFSESKIGTWRDTIIK